MHCCIQSSLTDFVGLMEYVGYVVTVEPPPLFFLRLYYFATGSVIFDCPASSCMTCLSVYVCVGGRILSGETHCLALRLRGFDAIISSAMTYPCRNLVRIHLAMGVRWSLLRQIGWRCYEL